MCSGPWRTQPVGRFSPVLPGVMPESASSPHRFRAHVEPELVKQWLGPSKYEVVIDRYEVRDGGRWRFVHRDTEGHEFGFRGVFHGTPSVENGIVQTWEFEGAPGHVSLQTATF